MPLNKPTISHQLKTVKYHKRKASSVIHSIPNIIAYSPQNRSHLVSAQAQPKPVAFNKNLLESSQLSNSQLKECTKLLRNVLSSDENKSTSTDEFYNPKFVNSRSVAFKSPDLSSNSEPKAKLGNQADVIVEEFDDRTDAESLTSNPDRKSNTLNTNTVQQKHIHSQLSNNIINYCNCNSTNNQTMHDSRLPHGSGDAQRVSDKFSICTRCHNIIPSKSSPQDKEPTNGYFNKSNEDFISGKIPDGPFPNLHHIPVNHEYKPPVHINDITGDKYEDVMTYMHVKINELQSIARVTRDADLGRLTCEIERSFQQMIRENTTLCNHLKTVAKTLKWENSALKQKIKNQTESNRDMKSELKLIRQEQKQKIEELKLEVQLKTEEIRQINDRDKSNIVQLKEKYSLLEKEHEKLKSDFQGQILQACHKDTDIIQLKHTCSQAEAKLKDEIHSLTLTNQNLKQEFNIAQTLCKKYEQELNHNQSIIRAAREQVVSLLDRHKQSRTESNSCNYRFETSGDASVSGEWIHQATNLQQVLSMASDNRDKVLHPISDKYNISQPTLWSPNNYFSNQPQSDQSNMTNSSVNNFATSNFNNNYVSSISANNPVHSDSSNLVSNYDITSTVHKTNFFNMSERSESPSNLSSTLSNHSLNVSAANNPGNFNAIEKIRSSQVTLRRSNQSSGSDVSDDHWSLPQPASFKKMSSASSIMSTVSSLKSCDDREFRNGLKRLDSQISRLQSTLQSNLQCK